MHVGNGIVSNLSIIFMDKLYYDPLPYEVLGVEILVPDPLQVKDAYEQGVSAEFPYWSRVWPSSLVLARWLNDHANFLAGKKLFEVGAGLGLPSFIAAKYALSVLVSDHTQLSVDWLQLNKSKLQASSVNTMLFDWRSRPLPSADIVLLSDVGYREEDLSDVHDMVRQYVDQGSAVVLTVPARRISLSFIEPLEELVTSRRVYSALETEVLLLTIGITDSLSPVLKKNS
jgi:methyltransferase-like protein 23